jgi:hypothetical protein
MPNEGKILNSLQVLPGVGPSIAQDLYDIGLRSAYELAGQDAEEMYRKLCILRNQRIDRCVLYVFRCAVYFASNEICEPDKLKWWRWKD